MSESDSGDELGKVPSPDRTAQRSDNSSPLPLDYASPPKRRENWNARSAVGGALLAIIVVGWIGAISWGPGSPLPRAWGILWFFMLAAVAIVATVLLWRRRPMRRRGWFLFGVMIGLGIVGLLEGACWSAS